MLGPFKTIGSMSQEQHWVHLKLLAVCLGSDAEAIGGMSQERHWAHLKPSAVSLRSDVGPIRGNRQHVSGAVLGPFEAISSFTNGSCSACIGPLRSHRQSVKPICWADTSSWQNLSMHILGPYDYFVWQLPTDGTCTTCAL
jgi:hypothetical protein